MQNLFVTGRNLGLLRLTLDRKHLIERKSLIPAGNVEHTWGLSQSNDYIFLVPNSQRPYVIRFDKVTKEIVSIKVDDEIKDWHEGLYWKELVYISDAKSACLFVFSINPFELVERISFSGYGEDNHLNGLIFHEGLLWCVFHNYASKHDRQSIVSAFDPIDLKEIHRIEKGIDLHSLIHIENIGLISCSSEDGKVIGIDNDFEIITSRGSYPRGLASKNGVLYIGISAQFKTSLISGALVSNTIGRSFLPCGFEIWDLNILKRLDMIQLSKAGTLTQLLLEEKGEQC